MNDYITEVWVPTDARGARLGAWLPVDGMDYTTRDNAVDVAAEWEADGYTARIKKRSAAA